MNLQDIRSALQSANEESRRSALNSLRNFKGTDVQHILFTAMGDASWRVRKEAVDCYVYSKPDLVSVEQLLNLLRNEDNAGLRNSAAEAVIRLGTYSALPLIKMVQDPNADVRKFVIGVMGAIGDPIFASSLLQALNDPEVNVASAAAEQLGALGDTETADKLMQAILLRDEVQFRFSALGALGSLAKPASVPDALIKLANQDILQRIGVNSSPVTRLAYLLKKEGLYHERNVLAALAAGRSAPGPRLQSGRLERHGNGLDLYQERSGRRA